MFQNPFSFEGRIRRTEYGITHLFHSLLMFFLSIIDEFIDIENVFNLIFVIIVFLLLIWLRMAQGVKRCHDLGNSGWFQFIPFYVFLMYFADSQYGDNKYGLNPKGLGNHKYEYLPEN